MRAHCLQHASFEGLGSILPWLEKNNYQITTTKTYNSHTLPNVFDIDLLIIMGGPMSVNEEDKYRWLAAEKHFIKQVIEAQKPVLGVCLGAQLIASSLGALVMPNAVKEIGWFPIYGSSGDDNSVFQFPAKLDVFHWHGETFSLPSGATLLASNSTCANQAFQIGSSTIGLQFHLETTKQLVQAIVKHCKSELITGQYIQKEVELLAATKQQYQSVNLVMKDVLDYLTKQ